MKSLIRFIKSQAKVLIVLVVISGIYSFARLPALSPGERASLASHFSFEKRQLPEMQGYEQKFLRQVHPSLKHISGWISTVGASAALNDLDGDGLPNDVCYVDTRIDQVIVAPVPGGPARYKPFVLNPAPLPYDSETTAPMGCLPGDFNEDGLRDILVYYWGRTPILFLRRSGQQTGVQESLAESLFLRFELVAGNERWYTNAATQADLDGDGHIDLIIGNYFQDGARILDSKAGGSESMQHSMSRALNGGRNRLFLWTSTAAESNSAGTLVPQFKSIDDILTDETAYGWTLAVGAADLDGDLLPEIYFANDFGPDRLFHNISSPGEVRFQLLEGEKTLTTPTSKVVGRDSFKGMGVDFADLNGDGLLDIFVNNIAAEYALEESHFLFLSTGQIDRMKQGIAPYVDHSEALGLSRSGWGWDIRLSDFNNDGTLEVIQALGFLKGEVNRWAELHEIAMGNDQLLHNPKSWHRFQPGDGLNGNEHNPFFVRAKNGRFYDIARDVGLDDIAVSRAIATADVDGDGRMDFVAGNQWDTSRFYRNSSQNAGSFLGLHLFLPVEKERAQVTFSADPLRVNGTGRPAIGASATIYLPDGQRLVSQVDGGNGHSGKRSPDLHFGLGYIPPDAQIKVDLRWRNQKGQVCSKTFYLSPGWHTIMLDW